MRLLVTRPEPEASRFRKELQALGIDAILQPLLIYKAVEFDASEITSADALIFTSGNGVRAISEIGLSPQTFAAPVFCVGGQTARNAARLGFANIAAVAGTAQEIAAPIKAFAVDGLNIVHVSGEHKAFDLEAELRGGAISITTVKAYTMDATQAFDARVLENLRQGRIDGVTLMSARTAEIFAGLCKASKIIRLVSGIDHYCLSAAIATRLPFLNPKRTLIAPFPTREDFLTMIGNAARKRRAVIA